MDEIAELAEELEDLVPELEREVEFDDERRTRKVPLSFFVELDAAVARY